MINIPSPCHLEIQTHRKNPYGLLRTTYRENGKSLHKTIARFTGLPLSQLHLLQAAFQNKVVPKEEFKILNSREYGASAACAALIKDLGLHKAVFSRPSEDWVCASLAMIAGRLVYAGSKLSLSQCSSYSALWEACGIDGDIDVNTHCYAAMDRLFQRQEAIQKSLAKKHLANGTLILYDITSCYMEGEYAESDLVEFGYNRDRKRGHEQIVISLLCTKEGCPVAVEVLKGNTNDSSTVVDMTDKLKKKYGIDKVVFVGDRGMIKQTNYEHINHESVKVISALSHGAIKTLMEKGTIQLGLFDKNNIVEVIDGTMRYCLCKNPIQAEKETKTRQALLEKTTALLDPIIACTRKTKYSKEVRAGRVIDKYKMAKFIVFEGDGDTLTYKLDEEKMAQEAALDGCYIIYTDMLPEDMNAIETVESYKSLIQVEQAFRNMKTVTLEIRPVFHKTDDRIKCHVFICMLAYYVVWHMKQRLQPLFDTNAEGARRKYSFDYIVECLKCIRKEMVEFCGVITSVVTTPTDEQAHILDLLQVKI